MCKKIYIYLTLFQPYNQPIQLTMKTICFMWQNKLLLIRYPLICGCEHMCVSPKKTLVLVTSMFVARGTYVC